MHQVTPLPPEPFIHGPVVVVSPDDRVDLAKPVGAEPAAQLPFSHHGSGSMAAPSWPAAYAGGAALLLHAACCMSRVTCRMSHVSCTVQDSAHNLLRGQSLMLLQGILGIVNNLLFK